MSDEEVQSEEPEGVDVDTQEKAEDITNDEAMKNRFKLIEGEEVLLTKAPSPLGFMSMYMSFSTIAKGFFINMNAIDKQMCCG